MPKFHGYARASSREQVDTLHVQEELIKGRYDNEFARKGYTWGGQYTDRGVSGARPIAQRPEGLKLVTALEQGDVVVVSKLDRGFRNLQDLADRLAIWKQGGILFVSVGEGIDTGTISGEMIIEILGVIAKFERARIRERTREVAEWRKAQGFAPQTQLPYGFKRVGPKGARRMVTDVIQRKWGSLFLKCIEEDHMSCRELYIHGLKQRWRNSKGKEWAEYTMRHMARKEKALRLLEAREQEEATRVAT